MHCFDSVEAPAIIIFVKRSGVMTTWRMQPLNKKCKNDKTVLRKLWEMTVHNTCKLDPIAIMTIFMLLLCINLPTGDSLEYLLDITPLGNIRYWEAGEIKSGLVGDPIQSPWSDWRGEQPRKHHCSHQSQRILLWKFAPVDGEECW